MRGAHRPDTHKKRVGRLVVWPCRSLSYQWEKTWQQLVTTSQMRTKMDWGRGGLGVRCERRRCNCMTIECPLLAYTNHSRLSRIIDRRFSHRSTSQPESQHIFWRVNDFRLNGNHTSRPGATVDRTTICRNRLEKDSIGPIGR